MAQSFKKNMNDRRYRMWFYLFIVALVGVVFMIVNTFIEGSSDRPDWKQRIILFLYFTFMSNVSAVIISGIVLFNKVKLDNIHLQRGKVLMSVNLTVTSLIFWTMLVGELSSYSGQGMASTIFVHAITPIFALVVYFFDGATTKIEIAKQAKPFKTAGIIILFPVLWLIMAITVYYSMGPDSESAIYGFLDFNKSWTKSITTIAEIAALYPLLSIGYTWIYNK